MVTKLVAQVLVTLHILHDDVVLRLVVQIDFGDEGRAVFPLQLQHFAFDLAAVETDVPVRVDPQRILGVLDDERLVTTLFEYDQLKLHGRRKIAYDLKKRGIDPVMVDEYADKVDFDEEVERGLQKAESRTMKGIYYVC